MKSRLASYSFFIIGAIHNKHKRKNKFLQYIYERRARYGHTFGVRVQRVQRVQRVVVAADAAGFIKQGRGSAAGCVVGLCSLPLRGQQPFGLRVVVSPLGR